MQEELTRSFQTTLYVLLGTAGIVPLIVCASIATHARANGTAPA